MTEKTKLPGMFLMIFGGIGILFAVFGLIIAVAGGALGVLGNLGTRSNPLNMIGAGGSMVIQIIVQVLSLAWYGAIIYGGYCLMNCKNIVMAWIGVIMAAIPCSICCLVGLPLGIWGIIILLNEEVKTAFEANT